MDLSNLEENIDQKLKLVGLLKRVRSCWSRSKNKTEKANGYLILATFLRAYLDYLKLKKIMPTTQIKSSNSEVDSNWVLLCDLKERLVFLSNYAAGDALDKMDRFSKKVDLWFLSNYGKGHFSSPEMICKSIECSICGLNIKACSHIPGRLYNGLLCNSKPKNCELRSVSIVENPQDPRCRMWPWELKKDEEGKYTSKTKILTTFSLHEFLYNNEWEKNV